MLHLAVSPPPPPDHVMFAQIREAPPPQPAPPPPLPHFAPAMPHVNLPATPPSVVAAPALPRAITLPLAPPPQPTAQPGPPMPPVQGPPPRDYLEWVMARLAAFRDYPHAALANRIQGTVLVRFVLDRQGRVSDFAVVKSSGAAILDEAARDTVARAAPMPPMPPDFPGETLALTLPIDFRIRR